MKRRTTFDERCEDVVEKATTMDCATADFLEALSANNCGAAVWSHSGIDLEVIQNLEEAAFALAKVVLAMRLELEGETLDSTISLE